MFISYLRKIQTVLAPILVGIVILASHTGSLEAAAQQASTIFEVRVSASSDDAEERASGYMSTANPDLELVFDGSNQTVGMRFNSINIPPGAVITNAYIQFQVDEATSEATSLTIQGEAADNAATFTATNGNLSSRPRTGASVAWLPVPWTTPGAAGLDQRSPNIGSVLQEITLRPGWVSGNSLVIIITGSGKRTAESYDGLPSAAPLLHVEYILGGNLNPAVTISLPATGSTFNQGNTVSFSAVANDFEDGNVTPSLSWTSSINGNIGTGGSFSRSDLSVGVHIITATAIDSAGLTGSATTTITVFALTPVLVGAGDIAYDGPRDEETAKLLETIPGIVFTLGDNVYQDGTAAEFNAYYEPTWGRHKARTLPTVGNHDYHTPGASGYFNYFGGAAGDPDKGYYSYDLGDWHIVVLNSECAQVGGCGVNSTQGQWLQADLAANPGICTLAYFHGPLFSSSASYVSPDVKDFWTLLYNTEADVILNGHAHNYERFALQDPNGVAKPGRGIREFVVGTGGINFSSFGTTAPNSEVRNTGTAGILKLTLNPTSYTWQFVPIAGQTFTDTGSANCVSSSPPPPSPTATPTLTLTPTSTPIPGNNPFYASFGANGSVGGVTFRDEDILFFDGLNWSLHFDGSDVGVGGFDVFSFYRVDADTILLSFNASVSFGTWVADPWDIVQFDATSFGNNTTGVFSLYFDGNDVGLDTSGEKIDALEVLPDGRILISTTGTPTLSGFSGLKDEDILAFTPATLGAATSGTWALYFDGSDVDLATTSSEDIDALDIDSNGVIYLSATGDFGITGISGSDEDIFVCSPSSLGNVTACNFSSGLFFDGSAWGLSSNDLDAFNLFESGALQSTSQSNTLDLMVPSADLQMFPDMPTTTPTIMPTGTPTPVFSPIPTATGTPSSTDLPTANPTPISTDTPTAALDPVLVFTPSDDATVLEDLPDANYGATPLLEVNNSPLNNFLLKFVVSGVNGQPIASARLRLYTIDALGNGGEFHRLVDNTWDETSVTWNNAPVADGDVLATLGSVSPNNWYEVDLTSLITGDGTYSLQVISPMTNGADYSSKEGEFAPELIITLSQ